MLKIRTHSIVGFTLIEVLIAMTILSIILTMVYTILLSTISAREFVQSQTSLDRIADKILNLLIRDIQGIYIYQLDGVCFLGKSQTQGDRLDFITSADNLLGSEDVKSDICEVGYYLKPNPDEHGTYKLIRREDFFVDDKPLEGGIHIKIYDRVVALQFRYFDFKGNQKQTWNNVDDKFLPKSILVTLALRSAPRNSDPEVLQKSMRYYKAYIPLMVSPILPKMIAKPQVPKKPTDETEKE